MRVDTLEAYNVPDDILAIWRKSVGEHLLPVQERAVKEFGLFGDANLIVFSPTSSGKTFIGEMAAVRAARSNTKVFYLVPQKALAEEKFEELSGRYNSAGIEVVVSSRDRREYDDAIAAGRFQIAVVVFEKLGALLVGAPQTLESVGLVVVDELQLITDETRGPALELLLTKLRVSRSKPRIVGLSAVLGKAQLLADWLDAKLLVDTRRPVDLRKGVLCQGTFTYREHNSGEHGTETFADMGGSLPQELMLAAAEDITRRGEQVLIFVADRSTTVTCARILADRINLPPVTEALEELTEQEETHAREALRLTLGSAVAFHNADLSREERSLVERHFRTGRIRALFSTSTLAMGMNLPVKNVVLEGQKWHYFKRYHRWGRKDISRSEYENMSGRAGRLGLAKEFGRSMLVAKLPFQADVWLRHYAEGDFEEIVPTLRDAPMEDLVVDLLASGMAANVSELREMLLSSFTGVTHWTQQLGKEELVSELDRAIARCVQGNMAVHDGEMLAITRLGRACASKGIGVATGIALAQWAIDARLATVTSIEVLTIAAMTKAGEDVYITLPTAEFRRVDYKGEILQRAREAGVVDRPVFAKHAETQWAPEYEDVKAFKKALLLCDWIEETATRDLEESYQVWAGAIRRVGEELSWIVEALGAVATACGWSDERKAELDVLADRLLFGVRGDVVPLAKLRVKGLGRVMLRRLAKAGFTDSESVRDAGADSVRAAINHRGVFERLWAKVGEPEGTIDPAPYPTPNEPVVLEAAEPSAEEPVLVVDLKARRVTYRGHEIPTRPPNNLQRQPLLALAVLASRAGEVVTMAELAEGMFELGALPKRPVAPEARELRYRILRPIKKALDGVVQREELDHLVETVPGSGMRVKSVSLVAPESVRRTA
ncbi:MAG: DEAD/DEAH box helicase [Polyangiaceae bacterium]|jgi:helicase|nr:DEAD/DEAH box helicase [Polyangiaceae bacterium]